MYNGTEKVLYSFCSCVALVKLQEARVENSLQTFNWRRKTTQTRCVPCKQSLEWHDAAAIHSPVYVCVCVLQLTCRLVDVQ